MPDQTATRSPQLTRRVFRQRIGLSRLAESCPNLTWKLKTFAGTNYFVRAAPIGLVCANTYRRIRIRTMAVLSTVMTEVKSLAVDPQRRRRAIAQAEKARDKQVTDREGNNEFAAELGGFVEQRKLKNTGMSSCGWSEVVLTLV